MRALNLRGRSFGNLKVLNEIDRPEGYKATSKPWLCLCNCGKTVVLPASDLNAGKYAHCGCKYYQFKVGMRFGNWEVIDLSDGVLCRCDCGLEKLVERYDLYSGKSRGCVGCGFIRKGHDVALGARQVRGIYKQNAASKDRGFELDIDECHAIFQSNCFYCGSLPAGRLSGKYFDYYYNGIDRKDNSQGYTRENSVPCCKICNRAKHSMGYDEFMEWINAVVRHNGSDQYGS